MGEVAPGCRLALGEVVAHLDKSNGGHAVREFRGRYLFDAALFGDNSWPRTVEVNVLPRGNHYRVPGRTSGWHLNDVSAAKL